MRQKGISGPESDAKAFSALHVDVEGRSLARDGRWHSAEAVGADERGVGIVAVPHSDEIRRTVGRGDGRRRRAGDVRVEVHVGENEVHAIACG